MLTSHESHVRLGIGETANDTTHPSSWTPVHALLVASTYRYLVFEARANISHQPTCQPPHENNAPVQPQLLRLLQFFLHRNSIILFSHTLIFRLALSLFTFVYFSIVGLDTYPGGPTRYSELPFTLTALPFF